jgi:PIN domain nuclease of toxin-antitoxin system
MIVAVADTHTAIWYLSADPRLSGNAKSFIDEAARNGDKIAVSAITIVELVYLVERGRLATEELTQLASELRKRGSLFVEIPLNLTQSLAIRRVERSQIADMPDRIIAGTALRLKVPVISRDHMIQASNIESIW